MRKYAHFPYFHVLNRTIFFDTIFSTGQRDQIMKELERADYPKDSILFSQGQLPEYLFILVEGTVEFIQTDMKDNSNSLQRLYLSQWHFHI